VQATPEDHPGRVTKLCNLGTYLSNRYERTRNLQDLEAAIARTEEAVQAIPEDHPTRDPCWAISGTVLAADMNEQEICGIWRLP